MARSKEEIRKAFPYSENCFDLSNTISRAMNQRSFASKQMGNNEVSVLTNRIDELNALYKINKCENDLTKQDSNRVKQVFNKYKEIDQIRIESKNIEQRNKRLYIGIGVLLAGLGILLIANKKVNG
jgi:hypothetical protein